MTARLAPRVDAVPDAGRRRLRPGEALALRWQDFVEVGRAPNIERAVSVREVKPTKSEARRRVDLTRQLTEALAQWQSAGELAALTAGTEPSPPDVPDLARHAD